MKNEVTTIKKGKIFNISLNISHLSFFFLQSLITTRKIQCKSHGFPIYYFESRNIFQKCDFLQKFSLSLIFFFFLNKITCPLNHQKTYGFLMISGGQKLINSLTLSSKI